VKSEALTGRLDRCCGRTSGAAVIFPRIRTWMSGEA